MREVVVAGGLFHVAARAHSFRTNLPGNVKQRNRRAVYITVHTNYYGRISITLRSRDKSDSKNQNLINTLVAIFNAHLQSLSL